MGGGSSTQSSTTVDPQLLSLYMQNYANANAAANNSAAFQPYTGELVAPFSPLQQQGQQAVLSAANDPTAANTLNNALTNTNALLGYQAPTLSAPATVTPTAVTPSSVAAGQLANTDLTPYLNPYTNDVINSSLNALALARGRQQVSDDAAATAANAFGGTRQAVQNALTTNDYLKNVASTTAGLNQGAYANAQQAALNDINNRLAANEFNAGNQLNAGEFNANALLNAGEFNSTGAYNAAAANAANSLAGAGLQLNAANLLGNLSNDQLNQALQRAGAIEGVGAEQTAQQQAIDQAAYQEFLRQAQFPIEQQQLRNQALTEIPLQQTTTSTTHSSPGVLDVFNTLANVGKSAASPGAK